MSDSFTLRPATTSDAAFVLRVAEACMRSYAEKTWGQWDEEAARNSYIPDTHAVIVYGDEDIGCLVMTETATHFLLEKFYILPKHQRQGIGTAIMSEILKAARPARKPIRLRVLAVSPARRFFEGLGFVVTHSTPERNDMEWRAA